MVDEVSFFLSTTFINFEFFILFFFLIICILYLKFTLQLTEKKFLFNSKKKKILMYFIKFKKRKLNKKSNIE